MRVLLFAFLALTVAACSSTPKGRMPSDDELPTGSQGATRKVGKPYKVAGQWYYPKEDPHYDEVGYASWYGKDFHGKLTANGEIYNMNSLTAAHKTLPLPTMVKVTNLENGRTLVLRVNDRGPFVKSRIIDISRRGAQLLGFDKQGVTKVRVQALVDGKAPKGRPRDVTVAAAPAAPPQQPLPQAVPEIHFVQVGSYGLRENAMLQARRLRKQGHNAGVSNTVTTSGTFWRVRIGPFRERKDAEDKLDRVVADGFYEARVFTEARR